MAKERRAYVVDNNSQVFIDPYKRKRRDYWLITEVIRRRPMECYLTMCAIRAVWKRLRS